MNMILFFFKFVIYVRGKHLLLARVVRKRNDATTCK